jgi:hypothetical protein
MRTAKTPAAPSRPQPGLVEVCWDDMNLRLTRTAKSLAKSK